MHRLAVDILIALIAAAGVIWAYEFTVSYLHIGDLTKGVASGVVMICNSCVLAWAVARLTDGDYDD